MRRQLWLLLSTISLKISPRNGRAPPPGERKNSPTWMQSQASKAKLAPNTHHPANTSRIITVFTQGARSISSRRGRSWKKPVGVFGGGGVDGARLQGAGEPTLGRTPRAGHCVLLAPSARAPGLCGGT